MAKITRGITFGPNDEVVNTELHSLVEDGNISEIDRLDLSSETRVVRKSPTRLKTVLDNELWFDGTDLRAYRADTADYRIVQSTVYRGFMDGFKWRGPGDATTVVEVGTCLDSTNSYMIRSTGDLTNTWSDTGAAGFDTVSNPTSGIIFLFVIGSSTGNAATSTITSLSSSAPTLPSNYDIFRLIGYRNVDTGSTGQRVDASGNGPLKTVRYGLTTTLLSAAPGSTTYATVSTSTYVPAGIATSIELQALANTTFTVAGTVTHAYELMNADLTNTAAARSHIHFLFTTPQSGTGLDLRTIRNHTLDIGRLDGDFLYRVSHSGTSVGPSLTIRLLGANLDLRGV